MKEIARNEKKKCFRFFALIFRFAIISGFPFLDVMTAEMHSTAKKNRKRKLFQRTRKFAEAHRSFLEKCQKMKNFFYHFFGNKKIIEKEESVQV